MCLPGAEIMYFCLSSARTDYQLNCGHSPSSLRISVSSERWGSPPTCSEGEAPPGSRPVQYDLDTFIKVVLLMDFPVEGVSPSISSPASRMRLETPIVDLPSSFSSVTAATRERQTRLKRVIGIIPILADLDVTV